MTCEFFCPYVLVHSFLNSSTHQMLSLLVSFFVAVAEKRRLKDKVEENIRLGEREAALVRLCCPYSS